MSASPEAIYLNSALIVPTASMYLNNVLIVYLTSALIGDIP